TDFTAAHAWSQSADQSAKRKHPEKTMFHKTILSFHKVETYDHFLSNTHSIAVVTNIAVKKQEFFFYAILMRSAPPVC
ncbi:MAG: hypothetical protein PHG71_05390, partial [Kiritimatiellae bacterium]|nr:hypothetical protein [Kiritimatiellia bacterium]